MEANNLGGWYLDQELAFERETLGFQSSFRQWPSHLEEFNKLNAVYWK